MRFFIRGCLIIGIGFMFITKHGYTQSADFSFDHLTVEEGLTQSTVLAITQDAEGFMWFGTREGLNRYDAKKIIAYRSDSLQQNTISDNSIYCLLSDSRGRLWIGTRKGLNLYDPVTDSFRRIYSEPNQPSSLSNNTITAIFEDRDNNIWVGTRQGINLLIEKDSISFLRFRKKEYDENSLVHNDVRTIFQDKEGMLWIGTAYGFCNLFYRNSNDYIFNAFTLPESNDHHARSNEVNDFEEDHLGRIIIGTERYGLTFFDKTNKTFSKHRINHTVLETKAVRSILKDKTGNFWIGTIGGLFVTNEDFSKIRVTKNQDDNPTSISDNSIRSLFQDKVGSYWIGTFHGGVNTYSPLSKQFRQLKPESDEQKFRFKVASALLTDEQNNFWIGTEGNGLLYIDSHHNPIKHFKHEEDNPGSLSHDNIKCLLLEKGKGLWIGTIKGLDFYDFKKQKFIHYKGDKSNKRFLPDDAIYDILKDPQGKLWVATYRGGLLKFNPDKGEVEEVYTRNGADETTLSSTGITRLFVDSRQTLWVGTISGLNRTIAPGKFERIVSHPDPLSIFGGYILCIYEDQHKRIWVGTRGTGLNVLSEDGKLLRHFAASDGLAGNSVYGIQEDNNGYLWLSTENGLSKLDKKQFKIKNFSRSDGLVCKQFNFNSYHKDKRGVLYFGGYNGVVYFHPDSIIENRVRPTISLTGIKLFNREIKPGDNPALLQKRIQHQNHLEFRHDQNVFSVEFALLNYINAEKNQFAYKLEGFETEWNIVKEPVATYMNLKPGDYTLLVKGANNDGLWTETPRALSITILPPPWKTWWAYAGYVVTFLALLYAWANINKKRIKLEHDLEIEHLEKVKQSELHQAKLNFFTNIAHEIRTPVTLMAGPLGHLLDTHKHEPVIKKELSLVKSNTDRLTRLLNQLLDFQKQETGNMKLRVTEGNIVEFIGEIIFSFREFAESRKVALNFSTEKENIPLWFDGDELSKVFFNLLVNALKFTPGGGAVGINVHCVDGEENNSGNHGVKVVIEDNGLGIPAGHLEKIFHRFYQAENTGIQEAGFGIGLALTKGIIDLHHGSITVESSEATGDTSGFTRFTILVPGGNSHFNKEDILSEPLRCFSFDPVEHTVAHADTVIMNNGERPIVLLVEDNDEIRVFLREVLQPHYEVFESRNGCEGLETAVEKLPDIIISDVMMPRMNGLDLVAKLKSDQRTSHIPIILLTARGTLNHQVEGLETGADDYLIKPFNTNLLMVKIKNHLRLREKMKEKYSRMVTLEPKHEELVGPDDKFLQRLMTILEEHIVDTDFNVSKLTREIGMSRPVLFRKTKMLTGFSVIDLIKNVRMKKAEMLLKQKKMTISEVAFTVGFSDPKYFSKSFRNQFGKPPSQYLDDLG